MSRILTRLSSVVPLCLLAGCALSEEEDLKAAMQAVPQVEKEFGGTFGNATVQRYVSDIGMRMARSSGRTDFPWQFKVLDTDVVNAFALPGGKVYITRGLLARLENEAELAAILGHEVGHVVRGHPIQQLERVGALQNGAVLAAMIAGSNSSGRISPFMTGARKNSLDQEREADLIGLNYIVQQGYAPYAVLRTMEILKSASEGEPAAEFLSNHPTPDDRQRYLQEEIARKYGRSLQGRTNAEQFRRMVFQRR
jgi:predicted Zn-dependent protease